MLGSLGSGEKDGEEKADLAEAVAEFGVHPMKVGICGSPDGEEKN